VTEPMVEQNDLERLKRYLQWATALVLVAVAVTAIDLTIKQGILRAVKEATQIGESPVSASTRNGSNVVSDYSMDRTTRSTENSDKDGSSRFAGSESPEDSETDKSPGDVLRIDE
jgi:hypothetical protein